jgi:hypothetical protein
MFELTRRSMLRSLFCAAPAVVVAAHLMPVRGLLLPPELILPESPKIIVSEELVTVGYQYGTIREVRYSDGTSETYVYGRLATPREIYGLKRHLEPKPLWPSSGSVDVPELDIFKADRPCAEFGDAWMCAEWERKL